MDIKRFLEKLSSSTPTPGGGSASALAGALSASLIAMVAGLTSEKKGMKELKRKALTLQGKLFEAVSGDAASYDRVIKAYRLRKETEKERRNRQRAIQRAYRNATVPPRLVCQHSIELLDYCQFLILNGRPSAISDVGAAAFLADTALKGGLLNIGINLTYLRDKGFAKKMNQLRQRLDKRRGLLIKRIEKLLQKNLPI
jgi:formiminotetrahydrofolate cyclodeaminase